MYIDRHNFRKVVCGQTTRWAANILAQNSSVKQRDLLQATTLMTPLLDKIWGDYKVIWHGDMCDFSPYQLGEFILRCNDIGAFGHMTFPVIGGLVYLAEAFQVQITGGIITGPLTISKHGPSTRH